MRIGTEGPVEQRVSETVGILSDAIINAEKAEVKAAIMGAVSGMAERQAFVTGFDAEGNPVRTGPFSKKNAVGSLIAVVPEKKGGNGLKSVKVGILTEKDGHYYIGAASDSNKVYESFFVLFGPKDAKKITKRGASELAKIVSVRLSVDSTVDNEQIVVIPSVLGKNETETAKSYVDKMVNLPVIKHKKKQANGRKNSSEDMTEEIESKTYSKTHYTLVASGVDKKMIFYRSATDGNENLLTALLFANAHERLAAKISGDKDTRGYIPGLNRRPTVNGDTVSEVAVEGDGVQTILEDSHTEPMEVGDTVRIGADTATYTVESISDQNVTLVDGWDVRVNVATNSILISTNGKRLVVMPDGVQSEVRLSETATSPKTSTFPLDMPVSISEEMGAEMGFEADEDGNLSVTISQSTTNQNGEQMYSVNQEGELPFVATEKNLAAIGISVRSAGDNSSSLVGSGVTHILTTTNPRYSGPAKVTLDSDSDSMVGRITLREKGTAVDHVLSVENPVISGIDFGFNKRAGQPPVDVNFTDFVGENLEMLPSTSIKPYRQKVRASFGSSKIGKAALDHGLRVLSILKKVLPNINVSIDPSEFQAALGQAEAAGVKLTYMETGDGVLYGFEFNGSIYFNPEYLTADIAIHEFGHIWNTWAKQNAPQLYQAAMDAVRGTTYEARCAQGLPTPDNRRRYS